MESFIVKSKPWRDQKNAKKITKNLENEGREEEERKKKERKKKKKRKINRN